MQGWIEINLVVGGGWSPDKLDSMTIEDFLGWYRAAIDINQKQADAIKPS